MVSTNWRNCPFCKKSIEVLRGLLPAHSIPLRGDVGWPVRLPELSPCDYFLWDYVEAEVYKHRPTTIDRLKPANCQTVNKISPEMIRRLMENLRNRLQQCITARERHLEDFFCKT